MVVLYGGVQSILRRRIENVFRNIQSGDGLVFKLVMINRGSARVLFFGFFVGFFMVFFVCCLDGIICFL